MTEAMRTRVLSYHAWPPQDAEVFREQLFRANRYYNALVEDGRRGDYQRVRREHCPELAELDAQIADLDQRIEEAGGRKRAPKELKQVRSELNKRRKPYQAAAKAALEPGNLEEKRRIAAWCESRGLLVATHNITAARADVIPEMLAEPEWSDYWKADAVRREDERKRKRASDGGLRKTCGVQPGTYLAVEAAVAQAFKTAKFGPPRFKRFTGEGKVGVQVTEDVEMPEHGEFAVACGQVEIEPLSEDQWETKSGRRHAQTRARIRIGRNGRKPVWAEFNVLLHRRPVGQLLWAYLVARRTGTRTRYELQLTVAQKVEHAVPKTSLAAAINIGWRAKRDGELRVAYLVDESGHEEEVALGPDQRSAITYSDDVKQTEDFYFNRFRGELSQWMRDNPDRVSADLAEATQHIDQWRAHKKLARAAAVLTQQEFPERGECVAWWDTWKAERLGADADLLAPWATVDAWLREHGLTDAGKRFAVYGDWWRRKNWHLYQIECNRRDRGIRDRRETYRVWARKICDKYATIYLDDSELREIAKRPPPGTERSRAEKAAARNRTVAACSVLKLALQSAARPDQIIKADGHGCSQRCTQCGSVFKADLSHTIVVSCPCGHAEDQDARFCRNVLERMSAAAAA